MRLPKPWTRFIKIPENLRVPIVWAMLVVSLRAQGGSLADVEKLTAVCRKRAAAEGPEAVRKTLTPDEFIKGKK